MKPTLLFGSASGVFVLVHSEAPPSDKEWDAWISYWAETTYKQAGEMRQLVVSAGGAPTAAQRHRMAERVRLEHARWVELLATRGEKTPKAARIAIVTESAFVRGVVNALDALLHEGWFVAKIFQAFARPMTSVQVYRAFSHRDMTRALTWLDVPPAREPDLLQKIDEFRAQLARGDA